MVRFNVFFYSNGRQVGETTVLALDLFHALRLLMDPYSDVSIGNMLIDGIAVKLV